MCRQKTCTESDGTFDEEKAGLKSVAPNFPVIQIIQRYY